MSEEDNEFLEENFGIPQEEETEEVEFKEDKVVITLIGNNKDNKVEISYDYDKDVEHSAAQSVAVTMLNAAQAAK